MRRVHRACRTLQLKTVVGKGASKTVYEADDMETGRRVAWNEVCGVVCPGLGQWREAQPHATHAPGLWLTFAPPLPWSPPSLYRWYLLFCCVVVGTCDGAACGWAGLAPRVLACGVLLAGGG